MNLKLVAISAVAFALTPLAAFAQSAPAPVNQTGPGISAPVSGPTDMSIAGQSGNTQAAQGGMYTTAPRAAVISGYGSYAADPSYGSRRLPADAYNGGPVVESDED